MQAQSPTSSPSTATAALAASDDTLYLWDLTKGRVVSVIAADDPVTAVTMAPQSHWGVAGLASGRVFFFKCDASVCLLGFAEIGNRAFVFEIIEKNGDWPNPIACTVHIVIRCKHRNTFGGKETMPKSTTLTARVDAELEAELGRLATATGRTKSWLINEALRSYIANEQQFLAAVEEGKQALNEGRVIDHNTVVAAFNRIITPEA